MALKFLDLRGLQQVWTAILAKESALQTSIDNVKNSISFSATGYANALEYAKAENVGKIVMVSGSEEELTYNEVVYSAGPYVITGDGAISFLATSSGDVAGDELAALQGRVAAVEGTVATIGSDLDAAEGRVAALETKAGELEDTITNNVVDINASLENKVSKEDGKSLVADTEIEKLAGIAAGAEVNVIETVKVNGVALEVAEKAVDITIPEVQVKGVDENDAILSLNSGVISSSLSYAREDYKGADSLVLKGKDGVVIGSIPVADFVVDGMLVDVAFDTTNTDILNFTFNVKDEEGKDKVLPVDLSKYLDVYEQGEGITIDGKIISVTNPFTTADKTKLDETADAVANIDLAPFATTEYVDSTFVKAEGFNPFTVEDKAALDKVVADVAAIDLTPFATTDYVDNTFVKAEGFNPFTVEDKAALDAAVAKLANVEDGAQVNKIESVVFGEVDLVEDKKVDLTKIFAESITDTNKAMSVSLASDTFLSKADVMTESDINNILNGTVQE